MVIIWYFNQIFSFHFQFFYLQTDINNQTKRIFRLKHIKNRDSKLDFNFPIFTCPSNIIKFYYIKQFSACKICIHMHYNLYFQFHIMLLALVLQSSVLNACFCIFYNTNPSVLVLVVFFHEHDFYPIKHQYHVIILPDF